MSLSSSFMVPVNWWGISAQQANGILVAIPLTVGIHFSDNNNLAISAWMFTPTGLFQPHNISSVGMGFSTVMPNFAHSCPLRAARGTPT